MCGVGVGEEVKAEAEFECGGFNGGMEQVSGDGVCVEMLLKDVEVANPLVMVNIRKAHAPFMRMAVKNITWKSATDVRCIKTGMKGRCHDVLALFFGECKGE